MNFNLDANWTSAILELHFGVFFFLLGIPSLVFQTFIPEELRKVYVYCFKKDEIISLLVFFFWTITSLWFISDGVDFFPKYILFYYVSDLSLKIIFWIILINFAGYFGSSFYFLICKTFNTSQISKILTFKLIHNCRIGFLKNKSLIKNLTDIEYLSLLGKFYEQGLRTDTLLLGLKNLIQSIVKTDNYDGKQLEILIKEVLTESVCHNHNSGDEKNYLHALEICKIISMKNIGNKSNLNNVDIREVKNCVFKIGLTALEKQTFEAAIVSLSILINLPLSRWEVFKFSKKAFELRQFGLLYKVLNDKEPVRDHDNNDDRLSNVIAVLSWFYSDENSFLNELAINKLKNIRSNGKLTKNDFDKLIRHCKIMEFDTAAKITKLKKYYFSRSNSKV